MVTAATHKRDFEPQAPEESVDLEMIIHESWHLIAPAWPLKNLIAVNPLKGLEDMPIEEALETSALYFQQDELPEPMERVNRETIKWLQAFFDEGQATIQMPLKNLGFYTAWKQLAVYDKQLPKEKLDWLKRLPDSPKEAFRNCLYLLQIPKEKWGEYSKLLLTTLAGWASYLKYRIEWAQKKEPELQFDYLAFRATLTYLLWPEAKELLNPKECKKSPLDHIQKSEGPYRNTLLKSLAKQTVESREKRSAQLVFCIDVRSEPFRRALENVGDYETFGFAGFFGIPARITNTITNESRASCPVLLSPQHNVKEGPCTNHTKSYEVLKTVKKLYQSLKYTFATPFALVEGLGFTAGAWIGFRTFTPKLAWKLKSRAMNAIHNPTNVAPCLSEIPFESQCAYGEGALRMMGLTENFSPLVIFCGHGSSTQNNAYASSLDCGACGGHEGSGNARVLASILNQKKVREHLANKGIDIPPETQFIGAKHNTTTDEVVLFDAEPSTQIDKLKRDLKIAREANSKARLKKIGITKTHSETKLATLGRSQDWAQVRPEWGLAQNAAFIAAPRALSCQLDLDGRCFLHSYDYLSDPEGKSLETILTAPMVVAQWINTQYLFSTLDNASFGGGSKVTKNITGKIGIMQGNASDLMTGLSLQSVYSSDIEPFHKPQRLLAVVYAPRTHIDPIIKKQPVLQKLFGNGWVQLACIEPTTRACYLLERDFEWEKA